MLQLDDWVLCRVRQKGNVSRNTFEVEESAKKELVRYLTNAEEVHPTHTNYNTDMITECLNKDCRLLASILAEQALPPIETISRVNFQGINKGNSFTLVYDDGNNKVNYPITVSSSENNNALKRKCNEEDGHHNLLPCNKKLNSGNRIEDLPPSKTLSGNDVNYYGQSQSQDRLYDPNPSDPIVSFLELNEFTFTGYGNECYSEGYSSSVKWHSQDAEVRDYLA